MYLDIKTRLNQEQLLEILNDWFERNEGMKIERIQFIREQGDDPCDPVSNSVDLSLRSITRETYSC